MNHDNDLIRRAIFNVDKNKTTLNWVHVKNIFGVGSTRAKLICLNYHIDPESTNRFDPPKEKLKCQ